MNNELFRDRTNRIIVSKYHHELSKEILKIFKNNKDARLSTTQIFKTTSLSRQWVSKTCNQLVNHGLLDSTLEKCMKIYYLNPDLIQNFKDLNPILLKFR
jgi:predicted transcriptional regulator